MLVAGTNKRECGYTLIELTLYAGLLGILLVILSQFFIATLSVQLKSNVDSASETDAKYIVSRLSYDLRRAKSIQLPLLGQAAASISATINDGGLDTNYRYELTGNNLVLASGTASAQINSSATTISQFTATRLGNSASMSGAKDTIQIDLTVQSRGVTSSGPTQTHYQTIVSLR